jgi:hypothetical protein
VSERDDLIRAGLIRPRVEGEPTPEAPREVPCLRIDRAGKLEAERAASAKARYRPVPTT